MDLSSIGIRATIIVIFPKSGTHYNDLPFHVPSNHAAPSGLLSGLCPSGLTAARQISSFFSSLLGKNNHKSEVTL